MPTLKRLYQSLVPAPIRYPIGRFRRGLDDRLRRLATPGPLPPRELLTRVQLTPYVREYLEVGAKVAAAIRRAFEGSGPRPPSPCREPVRVLDFGCGLGRTLRHFGDSGWELHGCDVDADTLAWSRWALPFVHFAENGKRPPLPYPAGHFGALWAVSVFTHFDAAEQAAWAAELGRVLEPGGLAAISTMGPLALSSFPELATPGNRRRLKEEGFFFEPGEPDSDGPSFNARGAFHTVAGLERIFGGEFELVRWTEGSLEGFQDLALLRRRGAGAGG